MEQIQKTQSIDDVVRMGKVFAESKMFKDVQTVAQAIVKVQAGAELGIPPFQAISGVHIISGKAVIGAGLMASMVDRHPEYDFEVLEQTDLCCEIKFYKNGKARGTSRFTAEDAKKAGTQNMTKYPANMLYARAMSNGVKWYAPGVFSGPVYVPEEMQQEETQDTTYTEVKAEIKPANEPEAETVAIQAEEAKAPAGGRKQPGKALDTEATVQEGEEIKYATAAQKDEIIQLLNHGSITRQEKTKMLLNINRFDEGRAIAAIEKLKKVIKEREEGPTQADQYGEQQKVYRNMEETA